jgi:hypothetical protein
LIIRRIYLITASVALAHDRLENNCFQRDWTFRTPTDSLGGREGPSIVSSSSRLVTMQWRSWKRSGRASHFYLEGVVGGREENQTHTNRCILLLYRSFRSSINLLPLHASLVIFLTLFWVSCLGASPPTQMSSSESSKGTRPAAASLGNCLGNHCGC